MRIPRFSFRAGAAGAVVTAALLASCTAARPVAGKLGIDEWASGPVRWLLLPRERRALQRSVSAGEVVEFIEEFWRRRDPDPGTPGNPYRDEFLRRVEDADLLYAELGRRGSLTDRGRTVVLLGAPSNLQVTSRPALSWDPKSKRGHRTLTRVVSIETWGYRIDDLPPRTLEMLQEYEKKADSRLNLTLTFIIDQDRAKLSAGESLLQHVKRAAIYESRQAE